MQAPDFWWSDRANPGALARLLAPLSLPYAAATARRVARGPSWRGEIPVICVGNLTAGGAGKTPTVIALIADIARRSLRPAVVTRGYGGRERGPIAVDPARMSAEDIGDEPILLAAFAPVIVSRDRAAGARAAVAMGADVILLDDGFQNSSVARDLNLVVVDAATGFGNGRVLPAGPLREPVETGLARAGAIVVIGDDEHRRTLASRWPEIAGLPRLDARIVPLATGMEWEGLRVAAFAGIGRPEKFFATLRSLGADVVRRIPLADHQRFTPTLLARLEREARDAAAQLVTTEKDAVRLPETFREHVLTLPVRLEWSDPAAVAALLDPLLGR
jgi:tetraacyldisaccharide 4'-kinase